MDSQAPVSCHFRPLTPASLSVVPVVVIVPVVAVRSVQVLVDIQPSGCSSSVSGTSAIGTEVRSTTGIEYVPTIGKG